MLWFLGWATARKQCWVASQDAPHLGPRMVSQHDRKKSDVVGAVWCCVAKSSKSVSCWYFQKNLWLVFWAGFEFLYASIWVYTHVELECCPPKGTSFPRSGHAKTGTSHRGQSRHEVVYAAESVQEAGMSLCWGKTLVPFRCHLVDKSVIRCSMLFKRRLGAVELIRPTDARQCNFDFQLEGRNQDWMRLTCFPVQLMDQ